MKKIFALLMALLVCVCLLTLAVPAMDSDAPGEAAEAATETDAEATPTPTPAETVSETDAEATPTPEPAATPTPKPGSTRTVTIDDDCRYATVTGDFSDLFVRVAIIVESSGESGLFLTQVPVNVTGDTGTIVIPVLDIPNVTVTGVNVMLVGTMEEITSPRPKPLAVNTFYFS